MNMEKEQISGLLGAYGWEEIPSRNPYMYSYKNKDYSERMNFYFTTYTCTIQTADGKMKLNKKISTLEELEKVL